MDYFGHKGEVSDPAGFFDENNYVICRGATDLSRIRALFDHWNSELVLSKRSYKRQNAKWEDHQLSTAGGVKNALLNPHSLTRAEDREYAARILDVLAAPSLSLALKEIGRKEGYRLFQTMMFDHSVTPPHQDWIYLDSRPNGHVIAAWVALEDIPPEGIRFFVFLNSHQFVPEQRYAPSRTMAKYAYFLDEIKRYLDEQQFEMYAPPLEQGDVFFWGSRIIHGSIAGTNENLRRRSVAAHFLPDGYGAGDLERDITNLVEREHNGLRYIHYAVDSAPITSRWLKLLRRG